MKLGLKQLIFSALYTYDKDMLYLSCLFLILSLVTLCVQHKDIVKDIHQVPHMDEISLTISFSDLDLSYYQMLLFLILS